MSRVRVELDSNGWYWPEYRWMWMWHVYSNGIDAFKFRTMEEAVEFIRESERKANIVWERNI